MRYLIIYAHPGPKSLNSSLLEETVGQLTSQGHEVKVSDLYAQKWKAALDTDDAPVQQEPGRSHIAYDLALSLEKGKLPADIVAEQEKVKWADHVIFQFPLWWYGMPAIMKGWLDRVFIYGFSYKMLPDGGIGGLLQGKKASIIVTAGGTEEKYSSDIPIENLLYPIYNLLKYCGMGPLSFLPFYEATSKSNEEYEKEKLRLHNYLQTLTDVE
ncbi:Flavodoxin-like fold [Nakaseomyces glabratus]|nr:Flavodoxin-like fold [Nakaseomyces glabratus]KAH7593083.1 Flavodoxin-like fold [Nakaseomyces glabratus]KAH7610927.1 Flavodoxin-like fold [Nakaseomyces glabratus]